MSYGPEQGDMYRAAARYVGRIFSGTKPADLPIEQPTQFELVVNMRAPSQRILQEKSQPRPVTVSGFSGISLGLACEVYALARDAIDLALKGSWNV